MVRRVVLLACLAAVQLGVPRDAGACLDLPDCSDDGHVDGFTPREAVVPVDGALVVEVSRPGVPLDRELLDAVTFEVRDANDTVVDGDLELVPDAPFLLWYPSAGFTPDASYSGQFTVDNAALTSGSPCWYGEPLMGAFAFHTGSELSGPAWAPEVTIAGETHGVRQHHDLDGLVCCDGAYPYTDYACFSSFVHWDEGHCEALRGTGWLQVELEVAPPPEERASQLAHRVSIGGAQWLWPHGPGLKFVIEAPTCVQIQTVRLTDGEVSEAEPLCFGDDLADQLGELDLDPTEPLADQCTGDPYRCAVPGDAWDADDCTPWPESDDPGDEPDPDDGDPDDGDDHDSTPDNDAGDANGTGDDASTRGCACSSAAPPSAWAWLPLFALVRSRRRAAPTRRAGCSPASDR